METQSPPCASPPHKNPTTIPKKVSFPGIEDDTESNTRLSTLEKSKSVIPQMSESQLTKAFRPRFACFRTTYMSFKKIDEPKKEFHQKKRTSNFSQMSTMPTMLQGHDDTAMNMDDEGMYIENTQNKVEIKANLVSKTKLRTLNALASILKNRKSVPTDTLSKMHGRKKIHAYDEIVSVQAQVHADSYDTVVKLLKGAQPNSIGSKKRHIKVMVDLPKLPFGKHVAYNSVADFKKMHVVDFEPSAQLMDKVTNEIWIRRMERRRNAEPEMNTAEKKPEMEVNFQTEELQLYNSKLKVADENLYMHYSTGSKFWKRDVMEKQAGWRGLYRLEVKRFSELNVTSTL